ncbi:MAG: DUF1045 domain-containing protein [Gammaproteobacteria bacterium]|nr:DUF1045 domain-containing protein [Gammaproteobacteria bacterium]
MIDTDSQRFALYFTCAAEDSLYQKATEWLGHCIYNQNNDLSPSFSLESNQYRMVQKAAHYGFHATLKPPFRLRSGTTQAELEEHLQDFTLTIPPFKCSALKINAIHNFIALTPSQTCNELNHLAAQCVLEFEYFRAPLNEAERQKRLSSSLTSRQLQLLNQYGYPYVLDEFRFHMTLSDRLPSNMINDAMLQLMVEFSPFLSSNLEVDHIYLCQQTKPSEPFYIVRSYPLAKNLKIATEKY